MKMSRTRLTKTDVTSSFWLSLCNSGWSLEQALLYLAWEAMKTSRKVGLVWHNVMCNPEHMLKQSLCDTVEIGILEETFCKSWHIDRAEGIHFCQFTANWQWRQQISRTSLTQCDVQSRTHAQTEPLRYSGNRDPWKDLLQITAYWLCWRHPLLSIYSRLAMKTANKSD